MQSVQRPLCVSKARDFLMAVSEGSANFTM